MIFENLKVLNEANSHPLGPYWMHIMFSSIFLYSLFLFGTKFFLRNKKTDEDGAGLLTIAGSTVLIFLLFYSGLLYTNYTESNLISSAKKQPLIVIESSNLILGDEFTLADSVDENVPLNFIFNGDLVSIILNDVKVMLDEDSDELRLEFYLANKDALDDSKGKKNMLSSDNYVVNPILYVSREFID